MNAKTILLSCALSSALFSPIKSLATIIDTSSSWIGAGISGFGEGATGIFGQTFTAPKDNTVLDSFSFWLADFIIQPYSPDYVDFSAYLIAWEHNEDYNLMRAIGDILWQSTKQSTTNNNNQGSGWEKFTFQTGGIGLNSESKYVIFLSSLAFNDGEPGYAKMGAVPNVLTQDYFVAKTGGDFTSTGWTRFQDGTDAAVIISFSASTTVPEPATIALLSLGLAGLGFSRRQSARSALSTRPRT